MKGCSIPRSENWCRIEARDSMIVLSPHMGDSLIREGQDSTWRQTGARWSLFQGRVGNWIGEK